jgi:uncharacterized protein YcnI
MITPPTPTSPTPGEAGTTHTPRTAVAAVAALALALLVVVLAPGRAGAHVHSEEQPATAGSPTPVTFSFDHGCDGEPTTYLRVQIPEGVTDVVPQDPAGWTSTLAGDELRWDGGSVPSGQAAAFTATMVFTVADGTVVHFPTIQGCPTKENAWIQVPSAAEPEPQYPAPQVVVGVATDATLAADDGDHAGDASASGATTSVTREPLAASPVTETGSERSNVGLVVFLVVVAVIVGGATILYFRHRPRPRP